MDASMKLIELCNKNVYLELDIPSYKPLILFWTYRSWGSFDFILLTTDSGSRAVTICCGARDPLTAIRYCAHSICQLVVMILFKVLWNYGFLKITKVLIANFTIVNSLTRVRNLKCIERLVFIFIRQANFFFNYDAKTLGILCLNHFWRYLVFGFPLGFRKLWNCQLVLSYLIQG